MKTKFLPLIGAAILGAPSHAAVTYQLRLFDGRLNLDGLQDDLTDMTVPGGVNQSGFDDATGLGTISVSIGGAGLHHVGLFLDLDIDDTVNTFYNEEAAVSGGPSAGQSWEVDEPGHSLGPIIGDINTRFGNGSAGGGSQLDGLNALAGLREDVAMAMAWDFLLGPSETATVTFRVSESMPSGGFYLRQTDPDSQATVYLSSTARIAGGPTGVPDGGATLALLSLSLAGLAATVRLRGGREPAESEPKT